MKRRIVKIGLFFFIWFITCSCRLETELPSPSCPELVPSSYYRVHEDEFLGLWDIWGEIENKGNIGVSGVDIRIKAYDKYNNLIVDNPLCVVTPNTINALSKNPFHATTLKDLSSVEKIIIDLDYKSTTNKNPSEGLHVSNIIISEFSSENYQIDLDITNLSEETVTGVMVSGVLYTLSGLIHQSFLIFPDKMTLEKNEVTHGSTYVYRDIGPIISYNIIPFSDDKLE